MHVPDEEMGAATRRLTTDGSAEMVKMPCAKLLIKPDDVVTRSLPYGARTSIPLPQVPDEAAQIAMGKESTGNPVTPDTAEQTEVQARVRLWPTVKAPEDDTYTYAVPLPPWRLEVAALVIA